MWGNMKLILVLGVFLGVQNVESASSWWEAHASKFTCARPGYFVNEGDCRSFYRCVDRSTWNKPALQRYDFTCPNGMVFDPSVSVCTNPGPNGCAEPWWPTSNNNNNNRPSRPSEGGFGGPRPTKPESGEANNGGNSFETLPSIFESSKGPGDSSKPATNLEDDFGDDLLDDIDFDKPPSQSRPGSSSNLPWFNRPSSPSSSRPSNPFTPGKPGGPLKNKGNNDDIDPLDIDFGALDSGSPATGGENRGSSTPSFGKPSEDCDDLLGCDDDDDNKNGNSASSQNSSPSWGSSESSSQRPNNLGSRPSSSSPSPGGGSSSGGGFNRPGNSLWDRIDLPDNPSDFDNSWGSNELGQNNNNNRPSSGAANWGGPSRPTTSTPPPDLFDNSPWRPTGPWGSGNNDLRPNAGRPGRPSRPSQGSSGASRPSTGNDDGWWDAPVALPLRPVNPSITAPLPSYRPRPANPSVTAPPPLHYKPRPANPSIMIAGPPPPPPPGAGPPPPPGAPWANPFRPKYPVYEIVAYPTWPGPVDRRPLIIVYSKSKK